LFSRLAGNKYQVDDCILKFEAMNTALASLSARKKAGMPMPKSFSEINALLGKRCRTQC
jgi:hypothetical protein